MTTGNKVYVLPNFRRGLGHYANETDSLTGDERGGALRSTLNVSTKLSTELPNNGGRGERMISRSFFIAGPEHVKAIDEKAICQVVPADGSAGVSFTNMAYVEFYEEDIPWRYTPVKDNEGRLRPWMVLLACKEGEYKLEKNQEGNPVLVLTPQNDAHYGELFPRLGEQHLYAHVQVTTNVDSEIEQFLEKHPEAGVSRILCHRALERKTQYHLFLVPAFETGRLTVLAPQALSGGGEKAKCSMQTASWRQSLEEAKGCEEALKYPVYYHWAFSTGEETFLGYAHRMNPLSDECFRKMHATLKLDINSTGLEAGKGEDLKPIDMPVALKMLNFDERSLQKESYEMTRELKELLDLNPVLLENEKGEINMEEDPWVTPPIYGARHTLAQRTPATPWTTNLAVNDINLAFRNRAAAGLGAQVVKDYQEEFVTRAWGMVEQINKLNQRVREIYQMSKMNDASARKINELRTFNLTDNLSGIQSNAAVKLINKVSQGKMSANTMAKNLTKGSVSPMNSVLEQYLVGQGVSLSDALRLTSVGTWNDYKLKIINSLAIVRMIRSIHKSDFDRYVIPKHNKFFDFYPEFNALRGVFGIKTNGFIIDPEKGTYFTPVWKDGEKKGGGVRVDPLFFYGLEPRKVPTPCSYATNTDYHEIYTWLRRIGDRKKIRKRTYLVDTIENEIYAAWGALREYTDPLSQVGYPTSGFLYDLAMPYKLVTVNAGGESKHGVILPDDVYSNVFGDKGDDLQNGFKVAYYTPERKLRYFVVAPFSVVMGTSPSFVLTKAQYSTETGTKTLSGEWKFRYENKTFKQTEGDNSLALLTGEKRFNVIESAINMLSEYDDQCFVIKKGRKESYSGSNGSFKLKVDSKYYTLSMEIDDDTLFFHPYSEDDRPSLPKAAVIGKKKLEIYPSLLRQLLEKLRDRIVHLENNSFVPSTIEWSSPAGLPTISAFELAGGNEELRKIGNFVSAFNDMLRKANAAIRSELKFVPQPSITTPQQSTEEKKLVDATEMNLNKLQNILRHYGKRGVKIDVVEAFFNQRITNRYPVMPYPEFPDPTSFYLREFSDKFFLPSSGEIAKNSICCFASNPAFEEAFLAGMNTEMGRELLWREYPTDERGSYFLKFWDQPLLPDDFGDTYYDVKRIDQWSDSLGRNHSKGKGEMLVFAVRADLMQVYPQTDIYMVPLSNGKPNFSSTPILPDMCLWLTDELYIVGFQNMTKGQANNNMLVFAEKESSQRFYFMPMQKGRDENSNGFTIARSQNKEAWGIPVRELP